MRTARRLRELDRVPGHTALCAYEDQIGIGVLDAVAGWVAGDFSYTVVDLDST